MRRSIVGALFGTLLCASKLASAGLFAGDMAKCLVNSTSAEARTVLVKWMFGLKERRGSLPEITTGVVPLSNPAGASERGCGNDSISVPGSRPGGDARTIYRPARHGGFEGPGKVCRRTEVQGSYRGGRTTEVKVPEA